jgi:hypothetical protein
LKQHNLHLKLEKCDIAVTETEFCGTAVNTEGIKIDTTKLTSLFETKRPTTVKEIQSFLGMCNWFRDFIPYFADIATKLTELTKKGVNWRWTELEQGSMILLLHRISTAPCLRYFDHDLETIVYTDASLVGIGGWIGQKHTDGIHPVVFWSRKLIPAETNYPTHERELLALVEICKKFRALLIGKPIIAKTDHKALTHLQTQPHLSARQARWVERLQEFDIFLEYVPGVYNNLADQLSRLPGYNPVCSHCKNQIEVKEVQAINDPAEMKELDPGTISEELR